MSDDERRLASRVNAVKVFPACLAGRETETIPEPGDCLSPHGEPTTRTGLSVGDTHIDFTRCLH
ncbi:MAG: hypothetical protein ACK50P_03475, partial [Planctomycetaceae bacterium]